MNTSNTQKTNVYPPNTIQEFFDNTPEKWTKESYGRNLEGLPCPVNQAVCFCLLDGIRKVYSIDDYITVVDKIRDAIRKLFPTRGNSIPEFNDHLDTTFEDIKLVIKEANV